ncbi:Translation initiation factor 2 [Microcystis panniformis FACHB-1757]|uniref:Translation initiation factor 2 n=1 Tax=Microcystis panniformis FACHB-1757 TaxID=1638788 RepID=A0A0K1S3Q6_9CHRO|nr:Translation initiation factor 2 [Microcystis panniformis FACHB-1757]
MNVLIRSLQQGYGERDDFYTGGNMFIYFSREQAKNRDFRGPDFFAVLNVDGTRERQGWVIWEEEGRYPDVIVELTSPSTAKTDKVRKKAIYEGTFRTPDYFIYDPFDGNSLQGWHLGADQRYHSLERNERGWLWCETLGYWLGTWEGTIDRETAIWARFYDSEGNLIPLPEEAAQEQAAAAQEQAAAAQEQAAAAQEQAAAAQEQLNATQQALEAERQRSQRLAARLREMGIDL